MGLLETSLNALRFAVNKTTDEFIYDLADLIPNLLAALVIFVIGYVIAVVLSKIVAKLFDLVKFEQFLRKYQVEDALGRVRVGSILVKLVKYYVILLFLQAALSLIKLGTISEFLSKVLFFAPALIGALLLVIIAALFGELVKEKIRDINSRSGFVRFSAAASKFLIVFFALVMGLSTVGFDTAIITQSFMTLLQGVAWGVGLAVGIAFGLGGQQDAKEFIRKAKAKMRY